MTEQVVGGTLFLLVALGLTVLAGFALLEGYMLFTDRKPITLYVRDFIGQHPGAAAGIAFTVGLLGGHFWR